MLRLVTERIWKHVDDGNGRKFLTIILLQKETHVATCGDKQAHAFLHENTHKFRLSCSWFVL